MKKKGSSGSARGFALPTRQNLHKPIMLPPENVILLIRLTFFVRLYVLKGGDLRCFCEKAIGSPAVKRFVVDGGRWVWCSLGSSHLEKKS